MPGPVGKIPAVGTVKYNNFLFPPALSSRVSATPVYDTSARTIKYVRYSLKIETVIVAGENYQTVANSSTDDSLEDIRGRLLEAGQELYFNQQGLGDPIEVNVAGGRVKDSEFGPRPQMLAWEPIGSSRACRIVWECLFTIPECALTVPAYQDALAEWNYGVTFGIDYRGMTTRIISGIMEIPMTRRDRTIPDTVERFRNRLTVFPVPIGFKRSSNYVLSQDKRTLTFSITDSEIDSDNPYPPGVTDISVNHRISSNRNAGGFSLWSNTVSGTITVARGIPPAQAFLIFMTILQSRVANVVGKQADGGVPARVFWQGLEFEEEIYTRTLHFSVTFDLLVKIEQCLLASGLWTPVPGSWSTWATSMAQAFDVRGYAQLGHFATDDVIIDLCLEGDQRLGGGQPPLRPPPRGNFLTNDCPPPDQSWLEYHNVLYIGGESNSLRHEFYQTSDSPLIDAAPEGKTISTTEGVVFATGPSTIDSVIQEVGSSKYDVKLVGYARRAGWPITIPRLKTIGGRKAVQIKIVIKKWVEQRFQCPIFNATWEIWYYIENAPSIQAHPHNFILGTVEDPVPT